MIRGKAVQVADRKRLFHLALPAATLAEPRADAAQRRRQSQVVGYNFPGLSVIASGHAGDEAGDIKARRAAGPAGSDAVTRVI